MTDLDTTLAKIDDVAVHRCGGCDRELGDRAPSRYFCGETCQERWSRGEREPVADTLGQAIDVPVLIADDATSLQTIVAHDPAPIGGGEIVYTFEVDTSQLNGTIARLIRQWDAMRGRR